MLHAPCSMLHALRVLSRGGCINSFFSPTLPFSGKKNPITVSPSGAEAGEPITAYPANAAAGTTITLTASLNSNRQVSLTAAGVGINLSMIISYSGIIMEPMDMVLPWGRRVHGTWGPGLTGWQKEEPATVRLKDGYNPAVLAWEK